MTYYCEYLLLGPATGLGSSGPNKQIVPLPDFPHLVLFEVNKSGPGSSGHIKWVVQLTMLSQKAMPTVSIKIGYRTSDREQCQAERTKEEIQKSHYGIYNSIPSKMGVSTTDYKKVWTINNPSHVAIIWSEHMWKSVKNQIRDENYINIFSSTYSTSNSYKTMKIDLLCMNPFEFRESVHTRRRY